MKEEDLGVVAFRLNQMEAAINHMDSKLDAFLSTQQQYITDVALAKQATRSLETRVSILENKMDKQQDVDTQLQVNLAQKLGPGAIAGGIVAAIMFILKFMAGG